MTDCTNVDVRDALPDLLHGRLGQVDTATMLAHVESCAVCSAELALLRDVRGSAALAPKIDVDRIVAALPSGPRVAVHIEPERTRVGRHGIVAIAMKLAAAAAIIVTGALILNRSETVTTEAPAGVAVVPSSHPGALPTVEKPSIATKVPGVAQPTPESTSLSLVSGVQDLSDQEIETLIAELDQIESIPSAEPEIEPLTIDGVESEG